MMAAIGSPKQRWVVTTMGGAVVVGAAVLAAALPGRVLIGAGSVLAVGAACAWLGRCRHAGRLGLLPPVRDADGVMQSARWYCDACGRSWEAHFDHDRRPVVRYAGYDQTKLPQAARRAAQHERRRQAMAVQRAGLTGRIPPSSPAVPARASGARPLMSDARIARIAERRGA